MMFNRKPLSKETVKLKNGEIVLFYELTHGILNKVTNKSTFNESKINNSVFLTLMEYELVKLSKRRLFNLPLSDGKLIRKKIREILKKEDILSEDRQNPQEDKAFSPEDAKWFDNAYKKGLSRLTNAKR